MNLVFEKFESFLDAVKEITLSELEKAKELLHNEGKDITNISDIFVGNSNEFFDILPDGTLVKVNLYIATQNIEKSTLPHILPKDLYKYHIYNCSTISEMFSSGRKHRYKINDRTNGTFHYKLFDKYNIELSERKNQKLNVCKNCLKKFLNKRYSSDLDVINFNLKDFHTSNSSFFGFDTSELEKGEDATHNAYSKQWREISTQFKTKRNYTCEECKWKANHHYHKKFIHTHHQNGDKTNNGKDNLKVLCIECHSNVDRYHTQIKSQSNYKEFIQIKNNPESVSIPNSITSKPTKAINGKPTFAPNFFNNSANNELKLLITNAPIVNGQKISYIELMKVLDSSPNLVSEIWKYLKENNHSFIDNKNQTLALLLINMAEERGYYSLTRV